MKPKNMPERKNQRRKNAFARLAARPGEHMTATETAELDALTERFAVSARDVRTKKAGTRQQRQAAWRRDHPL